MGDLLAPVKDDLFKAAVRVLPGGDQQQRQRPFAAIFRSADSHLALKIGPFVEDDLARFLLCGRHLDRLTDRRYGLIGCAGVCVIAVRRNVDGEGEEGRGARRNQCD